MIGKKIKQGSKSGIALLMAVLVSSLFFLIGATIFKIALTELVLSSTGKDSQLAFYSADSGIECALYWNSKYPTSSSDPSGSAFSINDTNGTSNRETLLSNFSAIKCGGGTVSTFCNGEKLVSGACSGGFAGDTMIKIDQPSNGICTEIRVRKLMQITPSLIPAGSSDDPPITEITSRGYNTCNAANPRRVERAIKVTIE